MGWNRLSMLELQRPFRWTVWTASEWIDYTLTTQNIYPNTCYGFGVTYDRMWRYLFVSFCDPELTTSSHIKAKVIFVQQSQWSTWNVHIYIVLPEYYGLSIRRIIIKFNYIHTVCNVNPFAGNRQSNRHTQKRFSLWLVIQSFRHVGTYTGLKLYQDDNRGRNMIISWLLCFFFFWFHIHIHKERRGSESQQYDK